MNDTATIQLPYSLTVPLDRTKEVEIVLRVKERNKPLDWGKELRSLFEPAQKNARHYSLNDIERDIAAAVRAVRSNA